MHGSTTAFWRFVPWLSRLVIFPPVLIFTVISFRYFTNPAHVTSGAMLTTPEAFTDKASGPSRSCHQIQHAEGLLSSQP